MTGKNELRPVLVNDKGKSIKGFFHRFVYKLANYHSETHVLVELEDGRLRYFEPFYVQFSDRKKNSDKSNNDKCEKPNKKKEETP
ncbi:MAG: hypothetical protein ABJO02_03435 [Reichenbachiella sp.]|uniref:Uncharacterized protein n=1 Tax=Reichenbachiella faecimaris TaxID=692418 RepID=A0A1W2G605_REIFA|nr:hypothetical protein [Reichenbachiella faecimaris]SMD31798.1 hypothetical protein SAMN04488029_0136 [Reichenbachiella faecimaris]